MLQKTEDRVRVREMWRVRGETDEFSTSWQEFPTEKQARAHGRNALNMGCVRYRLERIVIQYNYEPVEVAGE